MVAGLFLITRTSQGVNEDRNLVREVIIQNDDADTTAQHIQQAVDSLNAAQPVEAGASNVYPVGYFDTVVQIGASPAGPLATTHDFIAYAPEVVSVKT
jgi:hypothetical protein